MDFFIRLELNPFEKDYVSSNCCVSMTVVFVDRVVEHRESGLLSTTIKKWPTVSSSTKVFVSSLLFSSPFFFSQQPTSKPSTVEIKVSAAKTGTSTNESCSSQTLPTSSSTAFRLP